MNIHEYVNELSYIHDLELARQCLSFGLVSFLMYTLIIQKRIMGCHGNGAISHSPNRVFLLDKNALPLVSPSE